MKKIELACIIEDDPIHLYITRANIEAHGIVEKIIVFKNGKDAYYKLEEMSVNGETLPQIIFLDLNMPIWDGWEFLAEFSKLQIQKEINIYILSSSNNEDDIERAKQYSLVKSYHIKPVTPTKIKEILML